MILAFIIYQLSRRPVIGVAGGVGAFIIPFFHSMLIYLQVVGLVLGVAISAITLYLKIVELRKKNVRKSKRNYDRY